MAVAGSWVKGAPKFAEEPASSRWRGGWKYSGSSLQTRDGNEAHFPERKAAKRKVVGVLGEQLTLMGNPRKFGIPLFPLAPGATPASQTAPQEAWGECVCSCQGRPQTLSPLALTRSRSISQAQAPVPPLNHPVTPTSFWQTSLEPHLVTAQAIAKDVHFLNSRSHIIGRTATGHMKHSFQIKAMPMSR